jgi:3-oxoacyl-[acyl-carrier protein] reductase
MTEGVFGAAPPDAPDPLSVDHVAPLVAYLASPAAQAITGQVFVVHGGMVALLAPPTVDQRFDASGSHWTLAELDAAVGAHFAGRDPDRMFATTEVLGLP